MKKIVYGIISIAIILIITGIVLYFTPSKTKEEENPNKELETQKETRKYQCIKEEKTLNDLINNVDVGTYTLKQTYEFTINEQDMFATAAQQHTYIFSSIDNLHQFQETYNRLLEEQPLSGEKLTIKEEQLEAIYENNIVIMQTKEEKPKFTNSYLDWLKERGYECKIEEG